MQVCLEPHKTKWNPSKTKDIEVEVYVMCIIHNYFLSKIEFFSDKVPLAGNSVHPEKKKFLVKYLPRVMDHLQDRVVDVKSVKELCK